MSQQAVEAVAQARAFAPTASIGRMSDRHVDFDEVLGSAEYESKAAAELGRGASVFLRGASGTGKTSLTSGLSRELGSDVTAIRLLVSALADPTDVGEVAKLAMRTMLELVALSAADREEVHIAGADTTTSTRNPVGLTGGHFGGGMIPASIDVQVGSLRQEFVENKLDGEYPLALNRILTIIAGAGHRVIFVMDDAEAIVGAENQFTIAEGFLGGPVRTFVEQIDAPLLFTTQPELVEDSEAYGRLVGAVLEIEMPRVDESVDKGITPILERSLQVAELAYSLDEILTDLALAGIMQFYDDTHGNLRKTLNALSLAVDDAASMAAHLVTDVHVRVGAQQAL